MSNAAAYATALLELATENGSAKEVYEQCAELERALSADRTLLSFFTSPNLTVAEREGGIDKVLPQTDRLLRNTIKLLCAKGEGAELPAVLRLVREQYQTERGLLPVQAVTAVPLSEGQSAKLRAALAAETGKTILLENLVDPTVLGGVRLMMDGKRLDGTVQARLAAMKQRLNQDLNFDLQ